jgi:ABC transporter with metal-binding/Fe-S-binding domain ATP-binding protein
MIIMPIRVAVLFSGGKDSTFAIYHCQKKGYDIRHLIAMVPENPESYMFHHPNIGLAETLAKSMRIPIIMQETRGEKEAELRDLKKAISRIRQDVDAVVAGGLASKYQADRIGSVCQSLGLKFLAPLWNVEGGKYWKMLLQAGFRVMIVSVSADGLGKEWLGRVIDEQAFRELKALSKKFRFHLGFEGGEAETLVLDAPMYKKRLEVLDAKIKWDGETGKYLVNDFLSINKQELAGLMASYNKRKAEIKARLKDFRKVFEGSDWDVFEELSFCLCTPQSKAVKCDQAVRKLSGKRLLFKGGWEAISKILKSNGVRFHNQKAKCIVKARKAFTNKGIMATKERIDKTDVNKTRQWLIDNITGMSFKESSHFLRNIGLGWDIAILDRHILKNLKRLGVIDELPKTLTKKRYLDIENRMRTFSKAIGIPLDELDLLFWSEETGHVFK